MRTKIFSLLLLFATLAAFQLSEAKIIVVASTTDLASIAEEIGAGLIEVSSIARGEQDAHDIEVLPSSIMTVQNAKLYLKVGMGLDNWADKIIQSAENPNLIVLDCSRGIQPIQEREEHGDHFHVNGNPHYWLGVNNLERITNNIYEGLVRADAINTEEYSEALEDFRVNLKSSITAWKAALEPFSGSSVIVYHESWSYFARDFKLNIAGVVENRPGVSPSALHLAELEKLIRDKQVKVLLKEPYFTDETANLLAKDTGISVIIAPTSVKGVTESKDIFSHFDYLVNQLVKAFANQQ